MTTGRDNLKPHGPLPATPASWDAAGIKAIKIDSDKPVVYINGMNNVMISISYADRTVQLLGPNGAVVVLDDITGIIGITFQDATKKAIENGL